MIRRTMYTSRVRVGDTSTLFLIKKGAYSWGLSLDDLLLTGFAHGYTWITWAALLPGTDHHNLGIPF